MSEQNKVELPELPKPLRFAQWTGGVVFAYSEEHMKEYAKAAVADCVASQSPAPIPEQVAQASGIEGLEIKEINKGYFHISCAGVWSTAYEESGDLGNKLLAKIAKAFLATQSAKQGAKHSAFALPDGWKMMPPELDDAMWRAWDGHHNSMSTPERQALYRSVFEAAPASVEQATGAQEVTQQAAEQIGQHERAHQIMVDAVRDLVEVLFKVREWLGSNPEAVSYINKAIALAGIRPVTQQAALEDGRDHPALTGVLDGILTASGWAKYHEGEDIALDRETFQLIFKAGQESERAPTTSTVSASGALVHVGTLCVFKDNDSSLGYGYDISTNMAGHKLLQTLDGVELYAAQAATDKSED